MHEGDVKKVEGFKLRYARRKERQGWRSGSGYQYEVALANGFSAYPRPRLVGVLIGGCEEGERS